MQEILTIQVRTTEFLEVKGSRAEALMITFDGTCDCENFKGKIFPGGVDTQKEFYPKPRTLSARYMLEGVDREGKRVISLLRTMELQERRAWLRKQHQGLLRTVSA